MSQLEEEILKQNVLEEHRQVHELQVRIKELRGDITRYMTINAELLQDLETARAELKAAHEQEPVAWDCGGSITANRGYAEWFSRKDHGAAVPLYTSPVPVAPAPEIPDGDDFNGTTPHLIQCIESLVRMNDCGVLVPHGIGGHARTLLLASANRLRQQPAPAGPESNPVQWLEDEGDNILVPRGLLGAACSAIKNKRQADKVVAALRHYTQSAAPAVPAEWRGEWEHTKGGKYRVLMLPNGAAADPRYPLMVVYQGQDGNIWARPAHDWHRSMTLLKPAGEKS